MNREELTTMVNFLILNIEPAAEPGGPNINRETSIYTEHGHVLSPFFTRVSGQIKEDKYKDSNIWHNNIKVGKNAEINSYLRIWNKAYQQVSILSTNIGDVFSYEEGTCDIRAIATKTFWRTTRQELKSDYNLGLHYNATAWDKAKKFIEELEDLEIKER